MVEFSAVVFIYAFLHNVVQLFLKYYDDCYYSYCYYFRDSHVNGYNIMNWTLLVPSLLFLATVVSTNHFNLTMSF